MIFDRIVCGVDGSPAGFEALHQAILLRPDAASVVAVTVCETQMAMRTGAAAGQLTADLREGASEARDTAAQQLRGVPFGEARMVDGEPVPSLLGVVAGESATLLAIGTHEGGRLAGMLLGSVATSALRQAPCSVLVARASGDRAWSPGSIVAGMDGSREAAASAEIAAELGDRFGATVRPIAAGGGSQLDKEALREIEGLEWASANPVDALVDASRDADLVMVGSRGLRAFAALGSVSERVAHQAHCSVLVVRPQAVAT
jgi:nucleotide-binding universal stress UspA family protein